MMTLEMIKKSIEDDIKNGLEVEILAESNDSIVVYDNADIMDRDYEIKNPNILTKDWLKEHTIITPSVNELPQKINVDKMIDWVYENIDKDMYLTLERIIICNDEEKDFDYLRDYNDELYSQLECNDLPSENQLGIMWYDASIVVVNFGTIIKTTNEMIEDGYLYEYEKNDNINYGLISTLAHEIRHLAQANPYLPEDVLQQCGDDEEDAEQYAINICDEHNVYILECGEEIEIDVNEEEIL
jgi:hypothetical protein